MNNQLKRRLAAIEAAKRTTSSSPHTVLLTTPGMSIEGWQVGTERVMRRADETDEQLEARAVSMTSGVQVIGAIGGAS